MRKLHLMNKDNRDAKVSISSLKYEKPFEMGIPKKQLKFKRYLSATEENLHKNLSSLYGDNYASKLIEDRVPMRGLEIRFIRKSLGLTLKDWADALGLSAAGVLKWEKAKSTRLTKVNEAAVRSFTAEKLKIKIPSVWSKLVAKKDTPKRLSLKIARAA